ncbi:MAG: rhodanese-like domain-containing protein, partial [Actinomycetota bacterium]|nr:rhodanese-like domain-containing protein [Actinomycetota bacterium]
MCDGAGVSSASGDRWRDAGHHHIISDLATAYLGDRRALEQIDREEIARRLDDGDLIVIDVRPVAEYTAGHIAARSRFPSIGSPGSSVLSRPASMWSPTAVVRTACSPTMPSVSCIGGDAAPDASRTGTRNGETLSSRSKLHS